MHTFRRGDVWWVTFDASVGGEVRKTRPAVVVGNDAANATLNRVVVVPVTSKTDRVYPGEAVVTVAGKPGKAMADQIATVDKRRLKNRLDTLSPAHLRAVEDAVLQHLAIRR